MTMLLPKDDPIAVAAVTAIRAGDVAALTELLRDHPGLETARVGIPDCKDSPSRTLLHVVADWPGHFPNGPAIVATLRAAGADVNARSSGDHGETPLHWAASSDDVAVLDSLLDHGADIDASGAVIAGGTPLADATAFGQWNAARRLVERGAQANLWEAAALGLMDRIEEHLAQGEVPRPDITSAFWAACHGGQRVAAEYLLARGAELNWISTWDKLTPLDAARRSGAQDIVAWLGGLGAKSTTEPG